MWRSDHGQVYSLAKNLSECGKDPNTQGGKGRLPSDVEALWQNKTKTRPPDMVRLLPNQDHSPAQVTVPEKLEPMPDDVCVLNMNIFPLWVTEKRMGTLSASSPMLCCGELRGQVFLTRRG